MRRRAYFLIIFCSALLCFLLLRALQSTDPHDFEGKCQICHLGLKNPAMLVREPDVLCLMCHPENDKRSHPSDIIPLKALPTQYPLFRNKIVCVTCHFAHRPLAQQQEEMKPMPGPHLLRAKEAGKLFCYSCHKEGFINIAVDSHALAIRRAHNPPPDYETKSLIDDSSRECLSCHDGTLAVEASTQVKDLSWDHTKDIGLSHPIAVDYASVYMRKPRVYHPPESLDPRIILINGKIGCETCHDHYSNIKGKLVMENTRSRLCLSCHNL